MLWAERSQPPVTEARPSFARVGWIQQEVTAAFVNSAGHVVVKHPLWIRGNFIKEERERKKKSVLIVFFFVNEEGYSVT